MPKPVELLWTAIKEKKYEEVMSIIEKNPSEDLVNAQHSVSGRSLSVYIIRTTIGTNEEKPRALIEYLLKHLKMDWSYKNPKIRETVVSALVEAAGTDGDCTLIKSVKDLPVFMTTDNQLTYELAFKNLEKIKRVHEIDLKKGVLQQIEQSGLKVTKWEGVVSLIRDITILHAIKTDDSGLFEALEQVGGEPLENLGEFGGNKSPSFLLGVDQSNPRIKVWRTGKFEKEIAHRDDELKGVNQHLRNFGMFQEKALRINAEHDAKATTILAQEGAERQGRMESALSSMN